MPTTTTLEARLTHRYVGAHAHLDEWRQVGTARLLPARLVREPDANEPSDDGTYILRARIPAGQDPHASARALEDSLSRHGCSHEHDCCGCRSVQAYVRRVGRRDFTVRLEARRNY